MGENDDPTPTHAGAVAFRTAGESPEFLLVTALDDAEDWVLPKGHIEPGEDPATTAAREVREEAGLVVDILRPVATVAYVVDGAEVRVVYFLARATRTAEMRSVEGRRIAWFSEKCAAARLVHAEARSALAAAARAVGWERAEKTASS